VNGDPDYCVNPALCAFFFAVALSRQSFLQPAFFAGLQIEGMPFGFSDDVLLLDFALEPA